AEAPDAGLVAEGLAEPLPEAEPDVLDRVMVVHLDVAPGFHVQVEEPVAREDLEHVVQERHPGLDLEGPAAVEVERDADVGLRGPAADGRRATSRARGGARGANCHQAPPLTRARPRPADRCRLAASRCSTARPCASSPSRRASRATAGPSRASVPGRAAITLVRLTKS